MAKTIKAKGIDVSYAQGNINWNQVKAAGIDYAIIRCGYGNDMVSQDDVCYARNATECERVGIPYGVYLFSYATTVKQAKSEAEHALRLLKGRQITWPVFLDVEDTATSGKLSAKKLADAVVAFCESVEKAGYCAGIYASKNWFATKLTDPRLNRWSHWVAQYNAECTYGGDYVMWQYTSKGQVAGIAGQVDMNYAYIDYAAAAAVSTVTASTADKKTASKPVTGDKVPDVTYRVRTGGRWLPAVTNLKDFAGIAGWPITDVAIKVTNGTVKYRVHVRGGKWLPYVTGYDLTDDDHGYAGNKKAIDAIEVIFTPAKGTKARKAKYRVSATKGNFWPWQLNADKNKKQGLDGYAGVFGCTIDRLQITIE